MTMKRSQQSVPKAETGARPGDGKGRQGMSLPQGPSRQPNLGRHGGGGALARVKGAGTSSSGKGGPSGSFMPVKNNAMANISPRQVGQSLPDMGPTATKKPNRKGGAAFYGEI